MLADRNTERAFMKNLAQKSRKTPLFFTDLRKMESRAQGGKSCYSPNTYYTGWVYTAFDTLFPSLLFTLAVTKLHRRRKQLEGEGAKVL
jgi:hypothetical protein